MTESEKYPPGSRATAATLSSRISRLSMQIPRKMSAHNVMASISRTLGTRYSESKAANEIKFAGEESKDKLYEPKHKQKLVRVLTVVAYIISVSLAAIVLSLYYMYIWDPSDHPHYVAKQRVNATEASVVTKSPVVCPEGAPAVSQVAVAAVLEGPASSSTSDAADRRNGTTNERTSPPASSSSSESPPHESAGSEFGVKGLLQILTSPPSQRNLSPDSTEFPVPLPSISADQFQAGPALPDDSTTELFPDDVLDD